MASLKHHCEECDSKFTIRYDEDLTEDSPHYCPFCGEYLIVNSECYDEED